MADSKGPSVISPLGDLIVGGMIVETQPPDSELTRVLSIGKADLLFSLAQTLANEQRTFFEVKGPGIGDNDTADFMKELRSRALSLFKNDYSEKKVCGENNLCVDFYFDGEETIVEVALGLRNPQSEYERDILKAIIAKETGKPVSCLIFISKPGAARRINQPGARAIAGWAERNHGIRIELRELSMSR
ncbi:MAG TPA: hypothetical protein VLL54_14290 [Pyrinomonadaceae bacterium]|nr:hypothetical protein [Pyrinomonadaceae bacterium]